MIDLLLFGNKVVLYLISLAKKSVASFKMFFPFKAGEPLLLTDGFTPVRA
jgi:hypothetical protein